MRSLKTTIKRDRGSGAGAQRHMARYNHYFPAFSGGELSPQMLGRSDTDLYRTSAQTIDNFIIQIQGGLMRRPGFKYIANAKVTASTRLIPFTHSTGAEYALEFSNLIFRIFKDGAVIGGPTEITTSYTTSELFELDFAQSGDTMYITHENHHPKQLTRTSDTAWTLADIDFECAPMYPLDDDKYGRTEDLGNTGVKVSSLSTNTLNASGTLTMTGSLFQAADVGKFMRIKTFVADAVSEANADITSSTSSVNVKVQDGITLNRQISGSVVGATSTREGSVSLIGTNVAEANTVIAASTPGYAYDSSFHLSIPNLYVKLPATTIATRTTGYSTVVTTTARTYSGTTGATTGTTGSSVTSVPAVTDSITGGVTLLGTDVATAANVDITYSPGNSIANTWGSVVTQYTGSSIASENVTVSGNVAESWGLVKITGYTNATTVTVSIKRPLSSTTFHTSQQWQMSRLGTNTGYPKHVHFHEGRCFFANMGITSTNVLVASKTNSITDFENGEGDTGTLTAATALDFTLSETESIQWIQPSQRLIIGATNGVFSLSGGNAGINPLQAPLFRKVASSRCSNVKPVFAQGTTFYTYGASKKVGAVVFKQGEFSGFDFEDMTKFSGHLTLDGIKAMSLVGDVIWVLTNNGNLRGITYNGETKLVAWHRHDNGSYGSIVNVGEDLYITASRTNGQFVEMITGDIQNASKEDVICVDSALTYDSTPATVITGLAHLEGELVDILADGASHPQKTVSGGQITLDATASVVQIGLPYVSTLKTNEVVGGSRRGSSESRTTRIHEVGVKFLKTNGAVLAAGESPLLDVTFNEGQVYGSGPDLFTGTKLETLNSGNTLNPTVTVTSSGALPISILGVSADTNVSET